MCKRKPLGRCASELKRNLQILETRKEKIKKQIQQANDFTTKQNLHNELQQVEKEIIFNTIDFASTNKTQKELKEAKESNQIHKEDNNLRLLGFTRKTWQETFAKKLFELENARTDKAESLHAAANSAESMLNFLEYEHEAKTGIINQNKKDLKDPTLTDKEKQTKKDRIEQYSKELILIEMNMRDTKLYLKENSKQFNQIISQYVDQPLVTV
jgi:hypothetical protein